VSGCNARNCAANDRANRRQAQEMPGALPFTARQAFGF
jgi:hypothetical protein